LFLHGLHGYCFEICLKNLKLLLYVQNVKIIDVLGEEKDLQIFIFTFCIKNSHKQNSTSCDKASPLAKITCAIHSTSITNSSFLNPQLSQRSQIHHFRTWGRPSIDVQALSDDNTHE